jgi:hypothetical protein
MEALACETDHVGTDQVPDTSPITASAVKPSELANGDQAPLELFIEESSLKLQSYRRRYDELFKMCLSVPPLRRLPAEPHLSKIKDVNLKLVRALSYLLPYLVVLKDALCDTVLRTTQGL